MRTDKHIRIAQKHAEAMYQIALERHQRNLKKFLKKRKLTAVALIIAVLLLCPLVVQAETAYTDTQIVNAIWLAEGGAQAQYAYGIRSVKYSSIAEARRICLNTIRNNRKRYIQYGYKHYPDYLSFLASRYCPTTGKLSRTEKRVNKNWLKNVKYFLVKNGQ